MQPSLNGNSCEMLFSQGFQSVAGNFQSRFYRDHSLVEGPSRPPIYITLATFQIYFIYFLLFSLVASVSSTVTWDKRDIEVKEGDDMSLKCTVTGLGPFDVIRVVHIQDKQTVTIADSSDVKSPFSSLPRYKVHYEFNGSIGSVLLHYRGSNFLVLF